MRSVKKVVMEGTEVTGVMDVLVEVAKTLEVVEIAVVVKLLEVAVSLKSRRSGN